MWESAEVFFDRDEIPVSAEDLTEMEQVGWPGCTLRQSRELAAALRGGLTVAADSERGPPGRYVLESPYYKWHEYRHIIKFESAFGALSRADSPNAAERRLANMPIKIWPAEER
jgi:hypothetical protein